MRSRLRMLRSSRRARRSARGRRAARLRPSGFVLRYGHNPTKRQSALMHHCCSHSCRHADASLSDRPRSQLVAAFRSRRAVAAGNEVSQRLGWLHAAEAHALTRLEFKLGARTRCWLAAWRTTSGPVRFRSPAIRSAILHPRVRSAQRHKCRTVEQIAMPRRVAAVPQGGSLQDIGRGAGDNAISPGRFALAALGGLSSPTQLSSNGLNRARHVRQTMPSLPRRHETVFPLSSHREDPSPPFRKVRISSAIKSQPRRAERNLRDAFGFANQSD
jgi:hypothetical protein